MIATATIRFNGREVTETGGSLLEAVYRAADQFAEARETHSYGEVWFDAEVKVWYRQGRLTPIVIDGPDDPSGVHAAECDYLCWACLSATSHTKRAHLNTVLARRYDYHDQMGPWG